MEDAIRRLHEMVEKCNKDQEKGERKKEQLLRENADLKSKLKEFESLYSDLEI